MYFCVLVIADSKYQENDWYYPAISAYSDDVF